MNGTSQRNLGATEHSSSPKHQTRPLSEECSLSKKISANNSALPPAAPPPPSQPITSNRSQQNGPIHTNGSTLTSRASLDTEDNLNPHRGRSPGRRQRSVEKLPRTTSRNRGNGSAHESCGTESATFVSSPPHEPCRFSYEDYKHIQIMGWLEEGAAGKEVTNDSASIPALRLTMAAKMSNWAHEAAL